MFNPSILSFSMLRAALLVGRRVKCLASTRRTADGRRQAGGAIHPRPNIEQRYIDPIERVKKGARSRVLSRGRFATFGAANCPKKDSA
jgi:hypothetical protein